ncbi:hypothetical protein OPV22_012383 [Ensete ventricosum]|uniref:Uncharacterized protein n=1 Tax=Ensete ventricosum TaxID=4639 RepID=A0AAV8R6X8_ENSVE|nr:hypothetical protein OPV22_012383 [Ensete ventricosum]
MVGGDQVEEERDLVELVADDQIDRHVSSDSVGGSETAPFGNQSVVLAGSREEDEDLAKAATLSYRP